MAAVFDASAEGLVRTTGIVAASSDYTFIGHFYVPGTPDPATYRTFFYLGNDPTTYTEYVWIGQNGVGELELSISFPATFSVAGTVLTPGWHRIFYVREGTEHRVYLDTLLDITQTLDVSAETHTHLYVGTDTVAVDWDPGKAYETREWSIVFSDNLRDVESIHSSAQILTGLVSDTPLLSDLLDDSGEGNDWTAVGAVDFEIAARPPASEYGGGTTTVVTDTYSDHDMQCPAEWENGFKAAFVKRFGEGDRTASHPWTGDWQGSTFNLSLIDDGRFRRQLRSTSDRFWIESMTIRMTTRANRAILGTPYTVFVGPIINITLPEPTLLDLTLGDIVSQGILSDHPIPFRKIGDGPLSLFDEVYESLDREAPEPQIYGIHRRTTADVPSPQGFEYVPTYIGTRTLSGGQYHAWLVAGHACAGIADVQTVTSALGSPAESFIHTSVLGDEGAIWLIPHYAGYLAEFGAPYEDLRSDTYGVDRRYTIVYGLVGASDPEACANGDLTLVVHVEGVEPVGDGSGAVITDRIQQYKHWLINYVANYGASSYQSGAWLTTPSWDVFGVLKPIIEEDTFDACSEIAAARLPIADPLQDYDAGYIGAAIIGARSGDRSSVKRWIADWNRSCGLRFGVNHYGQIRVFMLNPTDAIKAAAPLYTDNFEILDGSFQALIGWPDKVNRIPFKTDYHHETGVWRTVDVAQAADAIQNYGKAISSEDREYPFAPGITMANHLAVLETRVRKDPPRHVVLEATVGPDYNNQSLGYLDLGDYIRYTHYGAIAEQNEIRLAQVVRHQVQAGRRVVQVEAFDCEELIGFDEPDAIVEASPAEFNETCATAMAITQDPWTPFAITIDTTDHATDTSVDVSPALLPAPGVAYHAAWFTFTPWANGTLFLTTVHSLYDTQMAVLTGDCGGSPFWELLQFNDNDGVLQTSVLEFAVTGGVQLHILVYGYGPDDGGSLTFGLYFTEPE